MLNAIIAYLPFGFSERKDNFELARELQRIEYKDESVDYVFGLINDEEFSS